MFGCRNKRGGRKAKTICLTLRRMERRWRMRTKTSSKLCFSRVGLQLKCEKSNRFLASNIRFVLWIWKTGEIFQTCFKCSTWHSIRTMAPQKTTAKSYWEKNRPRCFSFQGIIQDIRYVLAAFLSSFFFLFFLKVLPPLLYQSNRNTEFVVPIWLCACVNWAGCDRDP